jgi:hypothetical protein
MHKTCCGEQAAKGLAAAAAWTGFHQSNSPGRQLEWRMTDGLNQKDHFMCVEKLLVSINLSRPFEKGLTYR